MVENHGVEALGGGEGIIEALGGGEGIKVLTMAHSMKIRAHHGP